MNHRNPSTAILAYDGLCVFEFGIAFELFGLDRPELDVAWYDCQVVGIDGPRVSGIGCIILEAPASLDALDRADTIIIPGWRDRMEVPPQAILAALRRANRRGAVCLSICSGAYVLAYAGLLDGRKATTHWRYAEQFQQMFPQIEVVEDVLYVDEGAIITSAGSAAGIDAGLHLIRRDYGPQIANMVARRLVMPPHREGGQSQFVEAPVALRPGRTIGQVLDWARSRLDRPIAVSELARQAAMSDRTFLRQFQSATGTTPKKWLLAERIMRARGLLETTGLSLDDVSSQCGFGSIETLRSAFRRHLGIAPSLYRSQFSYR